MKSPTVRVLFVSFADSPHVQGWLSLLEGRGFDVRLFTIPLRERPAPAIDWHCPTYVTLQPTSGRRKTRGVHWLLPVLPKTRGLLSWMDERFGITAWWLRRVIRRWQPHIIHSLPLDTGGKLARIGLESMPAGARPKWVASAWGSDLSVGALDAGRRDNIARILEQCDGFMADCRKDLDLAERLGLASSKRALGDSAPGNGGVDIARFAEIRKRQERRNVILVPKAFEREHANRTFTVIEALRTLGDSLVGFEVHLLMCSKPVRAWLAQMPDWLQARCHCHDHVPQSDVFDLLGRTRVMVAPSLADGTPNVLLEAMAAGALPVVSPIESTFEWITDGQTGLLAHALYPDQIAAAIQRALVDDDLMARASAENWDTICRRADRALTADRVAVYYQTLVGANA